MSFGRLLGAIRVAARANLFPGLVLQAGAASILAIYYLHPNARPAFDWFGALKEEYGYLYSALSTAISGGLVPFLFLLMQGRTRPNKTAELAFYILFWAFLGIQVDALYRLQAILFGTEPSFWVLVKKVALDQLVFTAFWSVPLATLAYKWKNADFCWPRVQPQLTHQFFALHLPIMVVSAWLVWVPAVTIIYSLPAALQFPMFSLVQCFWSLLVEMLNAGKKGTAP